MTRTELSKILLLFSVLVFISFAVGCKKRVAAAPPPVAPPAQPVQPVPPPLPTITLRAEPATIERGQSSTLRWEAQNAASVDIQPEIGSVTASGTRTVSPSWSVTYTAAATGPGGRASDTTRLTVTVPPPRPVRTEPAPPRPTITMDELFNQNIQVV